MPTTIEIQQMRAMSEQLAATFRAYYDGPGDAERAALDAAIHRALAGVESDTAGFRAAQYEDAYGYKGRPGTGGESGPQGGSGGGGGFGALQILTGLVTLGAALGGAGYGDPAEPPY